MEGDGGDLGGLVVRVLGPCAVEGADVPIALTALQRRIVARLALDAPRTVPTEGLMAAVWGAAAPASARASLANHVARIRAAAGPGLISTTDDGYALVAPTDAEAAEELLVAAERSLVDGEAATAVGHAEAALDRWRGQPYEDLGDLAAAEPRREHLGEIHAATETVRLEAALDAARTGWAVAEAERLVAARALDERRWALLVRALDRDGRRGDALAAVDRARLVLRDGAGLDIGSRLRQAEAEVLEADPTSHRTEPVRLVGRGAELARLLDAAAAGRRATVCGEGGSGRSSLLGETARRLRARRGADAVAVAQVRCPTNPATALQVLGDLLAEVGATADPGLGPVDGFVAAVAAMTRSLPVVLVVDDIHRAGPSSRAALDAAAELDGTALLCSLDTVEDAPGAVADGEVIALGPLDRPVVAEIVGDLVAPGAAVSSTTLEWLVTMSGGNPLILECLLEQPGLAPGPEDQGVPDLDLARSTALVDLVRRRLDHLDDTTRAAVEAAAVCGPEAPTPLLEALASPAALSAAIADGLLLTGPAGLTRFRHGAVQRAVYSDVPEGRRVELHHTIGAALQRDGSPAAPAAEHLLAAAAIDPTAALDAARAAAAQATRDGAHRDAARWCGRAVEVARAMGADGTRRLVGSLVAQGDALRLAGDRDHERILFEAADLAIEMGDADLIGDTAMAQLELGTTTETGQLHQRAVELATLALEVVTDPEQRAMIAAASSLAHSMSGHPDRCRQLFLDAEAEARQDATRRRVLPYTYLALGHPADLDRRSELTDELRDLGARAEDPVARFEGAQLSFSVALQRADGAEVRAAVAEMGGLVDRVGDVGRRWAARYAAAAVAHLDDDLDRSEGMAGEALAVFSPVSPSRAFAAYGAQLLAIRMAQGRLHEMTDTLVDLVTDQPGVPAWHAALALATARSDPATARHHAEVALADTAPDFTWLAGHLLGARAAALAGADTRVLDAYTRRLAPHGDLVCWQGTCAYGPVATSLAALAASQGDRAAATAHADTARDRAARLEAPVFTRDVDELMA